MSQKAPEKFSVQAIRGMKDVLPADARAFQFLESTARELFELYNYREIRTPVLEPTELFARSAGDASDVVVSKQMYTFTDPGDRSNTMRPEGTAGVVRALIEAGSFKQSPQLKLYYMGPMFRYEKPQKGRLRQFTQIGMELFGVSHPAADAEVIALSDRLLRRLGFEDVATKINTIGCRECRKAYNAKLREAIAGEDAKGWCEQCIKRAEINPMRVFDCKVEECIGLVEKLPRVGDFVCEECKTHFESVKTLLDCLGIKYEIDPGLVRGFDYYTRTVFEIVQGGLGAQNAVLGGGRYDELVEELGGPPTPGVGMSIGCERLILAMETWSIPLPEEPECEFYLLGLDEESMPTCVELVEQARHAGVRVVFDSQPRSARAGLKAANKSGARVAIIIGADELARGVGQWKNLQGGEQMELSMDEIRRNVTEA